MKARGAAVMGSLAVVTLGAAYVTWQRPKETKSDANVTVLDASKSSLQKIHYEDGTRFVDVTRQVDTEPVVWLKQGFMEGKTPATPAPVLDAGMLPDGGAKPLPPPPAPPPPTRDLRGNERAEKAWEHFTPFEAVRALGKLSDAKLKELGLDASPKILDLTVAGTAHRFRVNQPTPGFIGTYVIDEPTREVYLLSAGILGEIEPSSTALVDRRLHAFKTVDIDSLSVTLEGQKQDFVISDAAIPQTTKIAFKERPDKPDEFAKNWHDKIWNRMIVTDVLGKGELPLKGEPNVVLRIDYFMKGQPKGYLELGKAPGALVEVFGRTENTAGWVGLHAGVEELALEAKKLVSNDTPDSPKPPQQSVPPKK
jgi:hypothetical protein